VSVDVGAVIEVVAQGLGVLALWLSLRWQVRQEQVLARTVTVLVEALHIDGDVGRQRPDSGLLRAASHGDSPRNGEGEHG
jgi:hypothetical protein